MIQLILGGARSGKSSYAELQATKIENNACYIATATAGDEEMSSRIKHHRESRPSHWRLIEEPYKLAKSIELENNKEQVILIDCMTLWLSNWICKIQQQPSQREDWLQEKENLLATLSSSNAEIIMVSNEVGSGIIPMGELTREFVDQAGWLNQSLAKIADRVVLVTAGLPLTLKENSALES